MTPIRFDLKHCVLILGAVLALSACDRGAKSDVMRTDVSKDIRADAGIESVEALAADPERLKELMRQCKEDRAKVGDARCQTVSAAWRARFMGDGKSHYTPGGSAAVNKS